jgi:futalosine hydrolase
LNMLYVLYPTKPEAEPFIGLLESARPYEVGLRPGVAGKLRGTDVTVVISGVGQANTAQSVTAIISDGNAGLVMICGCAGAYAAGGLSVGDVAVASEEIYADMGTLTQKGWLGLEEIGLPLLAKDGRDYYSRFPIRQEYIDAVLSAPRAPGMPEVVSGVFLTVCAVTGTASRGDDLHITFDAICENMEGAAAAHIAALYGVPFVEIRGISNMAGDRYRAGWDIALASANCARVAAGFIEAHAKVSG